jgi:hypothetical protein
MMFLTVVSRDEFRETYRYENRKFLYRNVKTALYRKRILLAEKMGIAHPFLIITASTERIFQLKRMAWAHPFRKYPPRSYRIGIFSAEKDGHSNPFLQTSKPRPPEARFD